MKNEINREIKKIIRQLKSGKLEIQDVPETLTYQRDIIRAEREIGLRVEKKRGYDVIRNVFFVEEEFANRSDYWGKIEYDNKVEFLDFEKYYEYLEGDIYTRACYKYCNFTPYMNFIEKNKIQLDKLMKNRAFIDETLDDWRLEDQEELNKYRCGERIKEQCLEWIERFEKCCNSEEFKSIVDDYEKSELNETVDISFFIMNYIWKHIEDDKCFNILMDYMVVEKYPANKLIYSLCSIYDPNIVLERYCYLLGTNKNTYKQRKLLKDYVEELKEGKVIFKVKTYFDKITHFYCEEIIGLESRREIWEIANIKRYFSNFEDFIEYKDNDLRGVDLSGDIGLKIDFTRFKMDEKTILPAICVPGTFCEVKKEYKNSKFYVTKIWKSKENILLRKKEFVTSYFFDFTYFLNNDLSGSNLVFCDGIGNLASVKEFNMKDALMRSSHCEKFGLNYKTYKLNYDEIGSFDIVKQNELMGLNQIKIYDENDLVTYDADKCDIQKKLQLVNNRWIRQRIYYVSDIHLLHKLQNAECKSWNDIIYVIEKIIDNILIGTNNIVLIGGDVASDFNIYTYFIERLAYKNNCRNKKMKIVFILGNHELWSFPSKTIDDITNIYRNIIEKNGMCFIQNELLHVDADNKIQKISCPELLQCNETELRMKLQRSKLVIFGGIGFSGYNDEFNADQGIYRQTIDRKREIQETINFEILYRKMVSVIKNKNTVILTHMPLKDWSKKEIFEKEFVYVSGHTHKNYFYDDEVYRVYSDNQIGYYNQNVKMKSFFLDSDYDIFSDYKDGIYEISRMQYQDFYRGKNEPMRFTREINILHMLKKNGYYCFIHEAESGSLTILNGGAMKKLEEKDIHYYYENMDKVIAKINGPLEKYTAVQNKVAEKILKIGGEGTIHGCIVDIDWYSHVYVNPFDLTITGYWAWDMVHKVVYSDIPTLLHDRCPLLYGEYMKQIENGEENLIFVGKSEKLGLTQEWLGTSMYKASREIKKMQKLESNILGVWYDVSEYQNNLLD